MQQWDFSAAFRLIGVFAFFGLGCAMTLAAEEDLLTRTAGGYASALGDAERRAHESLSDFLPRRRAAAGDSAKSAGLPDREQEDVCCGFRIYEASVALYDDFDADGYYTYLKLRFDVDTDYREADIYADVWLRSPGGEYTLIHETEVFRIHGSSGTDDYDVEAELVAGFPPDYYDVLVEVYDAFDGHLVADYGASDSSALGLLPLEDISFDSALPPPMVFSRGSGGAGSVSAFGLALLLAMLAGSVLCRRARRSL